MKDFIEKITEYDLFNHLFPGVVFCVLADYYTSFTFTHENIIIAFFIFYFVGLVLSRLGSLVMEPLLKKIKFVEFASYEDFVNASIVDNKLDALSQTNNVYRTMASTFVGLLLLKFVDHLMTWFEIPASIITSLFFIVLATVFIVSYRKQTTYIKNRTKSQKQL